MVSINHKISTYIRDKINYNKKDIKFKSNHTQNIIENKGTKYVNFFELNVI